MFFITNDIFIFPIAKCTWQINTFSPTPHLRDLYTSCNLLSLSILFCPPMQHCCIQLGKNKTICELTIIDNQNWHNLSLKYWPLIFIYFCSKAYFCYQLIPCRSREFLSRQKAQTVDNAAHTHFFYTKMHFFLKKFAYLIFL